MAAKQDYYGILGVSRDAKDDEIRKSYRKLARKYHPDLNPGDKSAEDHFKKVQEAYDVLSDAKKRPVYDQYGFYSDHIPAGGGAGPSPGSGPGFGGFDFSEFVNQNQRGGRPQYTTSTEEGGFGGFRDIFSQFFNSGRGQEARSRTERGSDLEYGLDIGFWESIKGTQVKLAINRQDACERCGGTGAVGGNNSICPECDGSGNVT